MVNPITPNQPTVPVGSTGPSQQAINNLINDILSNASNTTSAFDFSSTIGQPDTPTILHYVLTIGTAQVFSREILNASVQATYDSHFETRAAILNNLGSAADIAAAILILFQNTSSQTTSFNTDISLENLSIQSYNSSFNSTNTATDTTKTNTLNAALQTLVNANNQLVADRNNNVTGTPLNNDIAAYNAAKTAYTTAYNTYQNYILGRNQAIQDYNTSANNYNNVVVPQDNALIDNINSSLQLYSYSGSSVTTLPSMPTAQISTYSLPSAYNPSNFPTVTSSVPSTMTSLTYNNIKLPTPTVQNISQLSQINTSFLSSIQNNLSFFSISIFSLINEMILLVNARIQSTLNSTGLTNLAELNSIYRLLLPDAISQAFSNFNQNIEGDSAALISTGSLLLSTRDVTHLQSIISLAIITQLLSDLGITPTTALLTQFTLIAELAFKQGAIAALYSAFGQLALTNPNLGPDNPIFAIAFPIALLEFIARSINNGSLVNNVSTALSELPELGNLTPAQKDALAQQLATAIGTAQLLVAIKLLGETLGTPALLAQILTQLPPDVLAGLSITTTPGAIPQDTLNAMQASLVAQGFGAAEAQAITQNLAAILQQGVITSPLATFNPNQVNQQQITNSTQLALLLNGTNAGTAAQLTQQVQGLANQAYPTVTDFQNAVIQLLQNNGISAANATLIASQILVSSNPQTLPSGANLQGALNTQAKSVLNPLTNPTTVEALINSLNAVLFGTPTSDGRPLVSVVETLRSILTNAINKDNTTDKQNLQDLINTLLPSDASSATVLTSLRDLANLFSVSVFSSLTNAGTITLSKHDESQFPRA